MRISFRLRLKIDKNWQDIIFGIPDSENELNDMFNLRCKVYKKYNYLPNNIKSDKDEYDDKSIYFIAKIGSIIIGSVRLIKNKILPTEKDCFQFDEPLDMRKISRDNRGEVSRLVVDWCGQNFLPRHLVMLGLIKCLVDYAYINNIDGGYGFIKDKLKKKLDNIKIPVHYIDDFKQIYNKNILKNYFNNESDKVWPIYYITSEIKNYIDSIFNNKLLFKKSGNIFIIRQINWKIIDFINGL